MSSIAHGVTNDSDHKTVLFISTNKIHLALTMSGSYNLRHLIRVTAFCSDARTLFEHFLLRNVWWVITTPAHSNFMQHTLTCGEFDFETWYWIGCSQSMWTRGRSVLNMSNSITMQNTDLWSYNLCRHAVRTFRRCLPPKKLSVKHDDWTEHSRTGSDDGPNCAIASCHEIDSSHSSWQSMLRCRPKW